MKTTNTPEWKLSDPDTVPDELLPEYRFDYSKARPNRFAPRPAAPKTVTLAPAVAALPSLRGLVATTLCVMALMAPNVRGNCQEGPVGDGRHSYRLPLIYTKPHEVLAILRGALSSSLGPYDWGQALTGTEYIIPNERDATFLIHATPDGFIAFQNIVEPLDVPLLHAPKPSSGGHPIKPVMD